MNSLRIIYSTHHLPLRTLVSRSISTKTNDISQPVTEDMIGTPDPISNLRPVKYFISPTESTEEKEWRLLQQKVDDFNQTFWTNNNTMFSKAKEEYEQQLLANGQEVTAEALSVFYKDFLDKAYDRQMEYNKAWWKMNISMLYPGFKATIRNIKKLRVETTRETGFWDKSFDS
ncbi:uncharacterized protein BX664DRAFT_341456 [Halteromyces radiatus]|uniref:uncharacterized protein n=1 Tax=Halteromyces radiatus TaxID=101107 RepID=UPI0022205348|nr:uncharacterized protein BX664DRAFT_341456 [Halteromyces radiatus]KAI8079790.1 hypothetical protein BX664DRAFT_341456 [Halteromyces radiatus]